MEVLGRVDHSVQEKAVQLLAKVKRGEERPIKIKASGYLCIKVGYRHRLLKRNSVWELMTHERYNRFTSKRAIK